MRPYEPGEKPYWVGRDELERALDLVQSSRGAADIGLTVDDGNSSDFEIVAPELRKRDIKAAFFVLAERLDQNGYLRRSQVRELAGEGFEVGSHGLNHVDWTRVDDGTLEREVRDSKAIIEDIIGRPVTSASTPFGLYDRRVLRCLRRSGYRDVFSSDGTPRLTSAWPTPRQSLRSGFDIEALASRAARQSFWSLVGREVKIRAKCLLPGTRTKYLTKRRIFASSAKDVAR
ncbi:polysaccharide deacetylase family protein [Bradyrhizobium ottawaense]|uniref:polysaccharide deacetylase family protein n=1 Tax=Bradyrhizobium ottawaense TaxID=931866 RepID=UPI00384A9996